MSMLPEALRPLLSVDGGAIQSSACIVPFVAMMKDISQLFQRVVYLNILTRTHSASPSLMQEFFTTGGAQVLSNWLKDGIENNNDTLIVSLLQILNIVPISAEALGQTELARDVKKLRKSKTERVSALATSVLDKWMKALLDTGNVSMPPVPAPAPAGTTAAPEFVVAPAVARPTPTITPIFGNGASFTQTSSSSTTSAPIRTPAAPASSRQPAVPTIGSATTQRRPSAELKKPLLEAHKKDVSASETLSAALGPAKTVAVRRPVNPNRPAAAATTSTATTATTSPRGPARALTRTGSSGSLDAEDLATASANFLNTAAGEGDGDSGSRTDVTAMPKRNYEQPKVVMLEAVVPRGRARNIFARAPVNVLASSKVEPTASRAAADETSEGSESESNAGKDDEDYDPMAPSMVSDESEAAVKLRSHPATANPAHAIEGKSSASNSAHAPPVADAGAEPMDTRDGTQPPRKRKKKSLRWALDLEHVLYFEKDVDETIAPPPHPASLGMFSTLEHKDHLREREMRESMRKQLIVTSHRSWASPVEWPGRPFEYNPAADTTPFIPRPPTAEVRTLREPHGDDLFPPTAAVLPLVIPVGKLPEGDSDRLCIDELSHIRRILHVPPQYNTRPQVASSRPLLPAPGSRDDFVRAGPPHRGSPAYSPSYAPAPAPAEDPHRPPPRPYSPPIPTLGPVPGSHGPPDHRWPAERPSPHYSPQYSPRDDAYRPGPGRFSPPRGGYNGGPPPPRSPPRYPEDRVSYRDHPGPRDEYGRGLDRDGGRYSPVRGGGGGGGREWDRDPQRYPGGGDVDGPWWNHVRSEHGLDGARDADRRDYPRSRDDLPPPLPLPPRDRDLSRDRDRERDRDRDRDHGDRGRGKSSGKSSKGPSGLGPGGAGRIDAPCRFFKNPGGCRNGTACKFNHD